MFTNDRQDRLFLNFDPNRSKSLEYLIVHGFAIAASNITESSHNSAMFTVHKVYSWDGFGTAYCRYLFDPETILTIGIWQNDTLLLFQNTDRGHFRWIYFLEEDDNGDIKRYHCFIDFSPDGKNWQRCHSE